MSSLLNAPKPVNGQHPAALPSLAPMPFETIATAAQSTSFQPERFQIELIKGMTAVLLKNDVRPCLLRAPTGSGKTFVISRVLQAVCEQRGVLWFWFVPYITLIAQTEDSLRTNSPALSPCSLMQGRNQDAQSGMVLLSTAQAVSRASFREQDYDADVDDTTRTLAAFTARARAHGLQIGMVVDEAHIGLDKTTEFGKFCAWLSPDYLIMATATPKDARLSEFLVKAGYSSQMNFPVARDEVVRARLNKRYIEAVVYSLGEHMREVSDLSKTVLRQSWRRNVAIKKLLSAQGIDLNPLLLVQVANGPDTVQAAAEDLHRLCKIPYDCIGQHTSDKPDHVLMASIANDSRYEVLIFKQSAGTGFDAPRAFVLASTKSVTDSDYAMQFVGRVMRVAREVRAACSAMKAIPDDLNTAFVYLTNASSQSGFKDAVAASMAVKSSLEGQTEKLTVRKTVSGAVSYGNRPDTQDPIGFDLSYPDIDAQLAHADPTPEHYGLDSQPSLFEPEPATPLSALAAAKRLEDGLDTLVRTPAVGAKSRTKTQPGSSAELIERLRDGGLSVYPLRTDLERLGTAFKTELKPEMEDMSAISRGVASQLTLEPSVMKEALKVPLNRMKEKESRTNLMLGTTITEDIAVVSDRAGLARAALACLKRMPHMEDEDYKIVVEVLASRAQASLDEELEKIDPDTGPDEAERRRMARDAAHWIVIVKAQDIERALFAEIARRAVLVEARPLPNIMVFPANKPLAFSRRNIYGVLPPTKDDAANAGDDLLTDDRSLLADRSYPFTNGAFSQGCYDGAWFGNHLEQDFSRALDNASFVLWWHRNPRNKPFSVRVVRADHEHYFYPDFLVCIRHNPADEPIARLIETKDDLKDASSKARHWPEFYGKVLFLTPDGKQLRVVNDSGGMGDTVNLGDLAVVLEKLSATRPFAAG